MELSHFTYDGLGTVHMPRVLAYSGLNGFESALRGVSRYLANLKEGHKLLMLSIFS